jgi:hypothetical protein
MQALLHTPSDAVLDALFVQSLVGHVKGEGYLVGLRRYSELLVAELQAQVAAAERRAQRETGARRRKVRVRIESAVDFTFAGQCPGFQMRGEAKFVVPDQVSATPSEFDGAVVPVIHADGAKGWGIVRAGLSEPGRAVVALR